MKLLVSTIAMGGLLAGCMNYKPESKTDLLTESGFKVLALNTPAKVAEFKTLPAHKLSRSVFKGQQAWVYPDRDVCGCVYVGNANAYKTYISKATQQVVDTRVNQMYGNDRSDPYNPTLEENDIYWGDAWDASDAYGLYIN